MRSLRNRLVALAFLLGSVTLLADSTVFSHNFTVGANTVLSSTTPDTGTSWTLNASSAGAVLSAVDSTDRVEETTGGDSQSVSYYATESPAFDGADVAVQVTYAAALPSADDTDWIILRRTGVDTFYAAFWYSAAVSTDTYILKNLAGTVTVIDSGDCAWAAADVVKFTATGTTTTTLEVLRNGSPCGTTVTGTDSSSPITSAGRCGLGAGALRSGVTTDDVVGVALDNFSCIDITEAGAGGSPFRLLLMGVGE